MMVAPELAPCQPPSAAFARARRLAAYRRWLARWLARNRSGLARCQRRELAVLHFRHRLLGSLPFL